MIGSIQMLAGLGVVLGVMEAIEKRRFRPIFDVAIPCLIIWLILGWATGWASPD